VRRFIGNLANITGLFVELDLITKGKIAFENYPPQNSSRSLRRPANSPNSAPAWPTRRKRSAPSASGEVDSVMVAGKQGPQVFTLEGAEHAYRVLIESMNEGALTLTADKTILYANQCFARMVKCPLEQVTGSSFRRFLSAEDRATLRPLLKRADKSGSKIQVLLNAGDGSQMPAQISIRPLANPEWFPKRAHRHGGDGHDRGPAQRGTAAGLDAPRGAGAGSRARKRLGLLGMRERLEMVGGNFSVESAPGQGTTIIAQILPGKAARGKSPMKLAENTLEGL
jgi:PAS domain S-box-containing protein